MSDIFDKLGMQTRGYSGPDRRTIGRCRLALARYRVFRHDSDLEIIYDTLVALGVLVPCVREDGRKEYEVRPEHEARFREFFS